MPSGTEAAPSPYLMGPKVADANRRAALVTLGAAAAVPAVVVWVILAAIWSLILGLVVAVVVAGGLAASMWRGADRRILAGLHARPADPQADARILNLVDSLCVGVGVPVPRVVVAPGAPNLFSVGYGPSSATLVVTEGLAQELSRVELEGALAHEIAHIRRGDVTVTTVAGAVLVPLGRVAPGLAEGAWRRLTRDREARADLGAVGLTRYPPALGAALVRMGEEPPPPLPAPLSGAWAAPGRQSAAARDFDRRVQSLGEL